MVMGWSGWQPEKVVLHNEKKCVADPSSTPIFHSTFKFPTPVLLKVLLKRKLLYKQKSIQECLITNHKTIQLQSCGIRYFPIGFYKHGFCFSLKQEVPPTDNCECDLHYKAFTSGHLQEMLQG